VSNLSYRRTLRQGFNSQYSAKKRKCTRLLFFN